MVTQELIDATLAKFDTTAMKAKRDAGEPLLTAEEKEFFGAVTRNAKFGSAAAEGAHRVVDGFVSGDTMMSFAACAALAYFGYALAKAEAAATEVPKEAVNA